MHDVFKIAFFFPHSPVRKQNPERLPKAAVNGKRGQIEVTRGAARKGDKLPCTGNAVASLCRRQKGKARPFELSAAQISAVQIETLYPAILSFPRLIHRTLQ